MNRLLTAIYRKDEHTLSVLLSEQGQSISQYELDEALKVVVGDNAHNPGRRTVTGRSQEHESYLNDEDRRKSGQMLLLGGADPNTRSGDDGGPLVSQAISHVDFTAINLLLEFACDINSVNDRGQSPLHVAITMKSKRGSVVGLLLASGANPNSADCEGRTPLMLACMYAAVPDQELDTQVLDMLLIDTNVNLKDKTGKTALHHAAAVDSNYEVLKYLLNCDRLDLNSSDDLGDTVLHYVAVKPTGHIVIPHLANAGSDLNKKNNENISPLYAAAKKTQVDNVLVLLQHNAEVPKTYAVYNLQPLHLINQGRTIMAMLIIAGHKWDAVGSNYKFPRNFCFCGGQLPDFNEILSGPIKENYLQRVEFVNTYEFVPPLKHLSRLRIRQFIGQGIRKKIGGLKLPQPLQDYMCIPELSHVKMVFSG